ncbi:hypothetical protein I4U23_007314 [Adineta vaga]|nr:hypothetical protein I4U23_007314 [Adineta vaga]
MSSSSTVQQLNFVIQQLNIYVAIIIFTTGIIGGLLNIIIFTSLKTFRQTSCGFYLTTTSLFNIGQALFALSTRILDSGFAINLTNVSWSCKLRTFLSQSCVLLSLTSMSLATIDQFVSMTSYRHWSSLRTARRHVLISCCVWCCHGIFAILYWDTPSGICTTASNSSYRRYLSYFYTPVLLGCLPIVIMLTFSLLAFFHIRTLASRRVNIVRLSHERQLTAMALFQVAFIVFASVPYTTFTIYDLNTSNTDPENVAQHRLISTVCVLLYYEQFASSFYIFCCVSKRFRKQLVFVLFTNHTAWLRKVCKKTKTNQITPDMESTRVGNSSRPNITAHDVAVRTL